jgi:uncharacterized membrane protein
MVSTHAERPPSFAPRPPDTLARATRTGALVATLGLIVLCLAWELWLAPTGQRTLAIKVLPLLPALPGLWRLRMYTYRWLSLLVWLYATEGLVRAGSESGVGRALAVGEVVLACAVFAACVAHIRGRLKRAESASVTP